MRRSLLRTGNALEGNQNQIVDCFNLLRIARHQAHLQRVAGPNEEWRRPSYHHKSDVVSRGYFVPVVSICSVPSPMHLPDPLLSIKLRDC